MSQENQNDSLKTYELVRRVEGDEAPRVMATVSINLDESEELAFQPASESKAEQVDSAEFVELQKKYGILMSSLPVGVIIVNENLIVSAEYTEICADIFGQADLENKNLLDLLNLPDDKREKISDYLKLFIQTLGEPGTVNPLEIMDLMPPAPENEDDSEMVEKDSRQVRVGYQMISQAEDGSAQILVTIEDLTQIKTANEEVEKTEKKIQSLESIIIDPDLSAELIGELILCVNTASELLNQLTESPDNLELISGLSLNIHKIAGLINGFGEEHIIDQAEQLLSIIQQVTAKEGPEDWVAACDTQLNEISDNISNMTESFQELTGLEIQENPDKKLKVLGKKISAIAENIKNLSINSDEKSKLMDQINALKAVSVYDGLSRTARMIQGIIDVTGENAAFSIEDSDAMIDYALAQNLNEPLIHLFLHILKHNIDAPEDRFDRNKVEEANISVSIVEDEDGLIVEMSDDGEGLDPETVKQTIVEKGLMTQEAVDDIPDDESLELIFTPGYYESDDDIQNGMRLDQIQGMVRKLLGGEMFVDAEPGEGTNFLIKIPGDTPSITEAKTVKQVYGYNAGYFYLFEIDDSGDCRASKIEKEAVPQPVIQKWISDGMLSE